MTAQATLFDFSPKAVPIRGWSHDNEGRAWIYRSNAKAVIRDLGKLPSGAGLCPRYMATPKDRWQGVGDIRHWQQCGGGGITKHVWLDGTVEDRIGIQFGIPSECRAVELCEAWIDGDLMHIVGGDGIERTLEVHEDSGIHRLDVHPFEPARYPEHYLMLAMLKGVRGDTARAMTSMPWTFDLCGPATRGMDEVYATYDLTRIVPMCSHRVHHITELEVAYQDRTCATCLKRRADGTCQSTGCKSDWVEPMCSMYYWDGQPIPRRHEYHPVEDDEPLEVCA